MSQAHRDKLGRDRLVMFIDDDNTRLTISMADSTMPDKALFVELDVGETRKLVETLTKWFRDMVEVRICEQCGARFEYKSRSATKGRFCTPRCGGLYNVEQGVVPDPQSERQTAARLEGLHNSPISGPFITHHMARDWFLVSPTMETYRIHNLKLFIREHSDLFTGDELVAPSGKHSRAYMGLATLAPPRSPRKRAANVWHGWRWWHEGEQRRQEALTETSDKTNERTTAK